MKTIIIISLQFTKPVLENRVVSKVTGLYLNIFSNSSNIFSNFLFEVMRTIYSCIFHLEYLLSSFRTREGREGEDYRKVCKVWNVARARDKNPRLGNIVYKYSFQKLFNY